MGNVVQNVTATTASDELQTRNGLEHQRVYDPTAETILGKILVQLEIMNKHLEEITGESFNE